MSENTGRIDGVIASLVGSAKISRKNKQKDEKGSFQNEVYETRGPFTNKYRHDSERRDLCTNLLHVDDQAKKFLALPVQRP